MTSFGDKETPTLRGREAEALSFWVNGSSPVNSYQEVRKKIPRKIGGTFAMRPMGHRKIRIPPKDESVGKGESKVL